jgi:predicted dehydrogenase
VSARTVALVGSGVIAPAYAHTLTQIGASGGIDLVAVADAIPERAQALADQHSIPKACTFDDVLADSGIDAIINLTPPLAHTAVSQAALDAGKHVFSEKPLGVDLEEGRALVATAAERSLRLGCAPDTFLGQGLQTCREVIDRGTIGEPVGANAFMLQSGPEIWHPHPDIFYLRGAGPMLDMGPYYFTALVQLLGPARSITGAARITHATRTIGSELRRGEQIPVEVPTHVSSVIDFANGAIGTLVTSFDVQASRYRNIEIYGTEATLSVPDPNTFGGPVRIRRLRDMEWEDIPLRDSSLPQQRGIGAADMLWALRTGRRHRAEGQLALHVLELMTGAVSASEVGRRIDLTTTCEPAALLPTDLAPCTFDD